MALGYYAGYCAQGAASIAIGNQVALRNQGLGAIAIGNQTVSDDQSPNTICIGSNCIVQGVSGGVVLGSFSSVQGVTGSGAQAIVLNATGAVLGPPSGLTQGGLWVKPVRGVTAGQLTATHSPLYWDTATSEVVALVP